MTPSPITEAEQHLIYEVPLRTIEEAERVANEQVRDAISRARECVSMALAHLKPVARSPLYGNGLHTGLTDGVSRFDKLDDHLQALLPMVDRYFNREDEG